MVMVILELISSLPMLSTYHLMIHSRQYFGHLFWSSYYDILIFIIKFQTLICYEPTFKARRFEVPGKKRRDRNFDPIPALSGVIPAVLKTLG